MKFFYSKVFIKQLFLATIIFSLIVLASIVFLFFYTNQTSRVVVPDLVGVSINEIDELISEKESELESQKETLKVEEEYKDNIRPLYNTIYSKLKQYDEETLDHNYKKFQECKEDLSKIKSDVTVKENKIKHLETSLEEVKEHEFDENCEYCLKNGQWHIEKTKSLTSEIKDCKLELDKILNDKWDQLFKIKPVSYTHLTLPTKRIV